MTQTHGSLQNLMLGGNAVNDPKPEVGMGATEIHWTDREPFTIVEVAPKGNRFWMTADDYKRIDNNGMSDSQKYAYMSNPDGYRTEVVYRKARKSQRNPEGLGGRWVTVPGGMTVAVGFRQKYHDFSF